MDRVLGVDTISVVGGADLRYERGRLHQVVFGTSCAVTETKHPLPYVTVSREEDNVVLDMDDGTVRWHQDIGYLEPKQPLGSGIGEYPSYLWRRKVFYHEVENWIARGWMVKQDPACHEPPVSVLPILAKVRKHKPSTPVRPCLDYCALNAHIPSHPGTDAPWN